MVNELEKLLDYVDVKMEESYWHGHGSFEGGYVAALNHVRNKIVERMLNTSIKKADPRL